MLVLLVSWSVLSIGLASHMQGGIMTFTPKGRNRDGTYRVDFRYKESFRSNCHQEFYWGCNSGNCGYTRELQYGQIDSSPLGDTWCQAEGFMSKSVPSDKPFDLRETSCCWVYNTNWTPSWILSTHVDLGVRSDTRNPNRSPVTTLPPRLRVPQNCPTTYSLLAHDPDGDLVKCRYGQSYNSECYTCAQQAGFGLNEISCELSYYGTQTGVYIFELVMEDFPQQYIQLQYSDGSSVGKAPLYLVRRLKKSSRTSSYATTSSNWGGWNGQLTTAAPFNWGGWNGQSSTAVPYTTTPSPWWWTTTTAAPNTTTPSPWWWWGVWNGQPSTAVPYTTTPSTWWWTTTTAAPNTTTPSPWWWWWGWNGQPSTAVPYVTASTTYTISQGGWNSTTQTSTYFSYTQLTNQDPLSKIPVQFLVEVTSSVPSCNFGDYRPQYLSPTPPHGQIKKASVNHQFQFIVRAQASYAVIQNIMISGPLNITKSYQYDSQTQTGKAVVTWTPSENNLGESVPICFFAETQEGYQSELRCIVVTVGRRNSLPMNIETSIVCTKTTMSVFVLKSSAPGLNEHYMRLNDPRCSLTSNSTHLIASVSLNSCGTRYQENDTEIIFENEITTFDHFNQVISRKNQVEIPFSCSYPKIGKASASFSPHKANYVFSEAGFGSFTFLFEFYESSDFRSIIDPSEYPIEVELGEMLYMGISVDSPLDNITLFVQDCRATPHDDPNDPTYYDIITDGCVQDDTTIIFPSNQTDFRFGMAAFTFIGDYSQVYMTCTVIVCIAASPGTRCSQGCVNSTSTVHRFRRSLASESQEHFISQGPLYLSKKNNNQVSLNPNTLVIVMGFIAAVAIVASVVGVVIYKIKMSKVVRYERLSASEI
ncbi:uncharacterized protein LOC120514751 isoform X2 [Polypterus senegalus]|uniref:uncharacterized protein LOC120514751 isoform X2 n=1 Tax=Polypterus senegalus TaxID=55291 RepID=UPI001962B97A|nr:uncharacterized protein LOC120514751 isoform X2 [Polypterus senegalus]